MNSSRINSGFKVEDSFWVRCSLRQQIEMFKAEPSEYVSWLYELGFVRVGTNSVT